MSIVRPPIIHDPSLERIVALIQERSVGAPVLLGAGVSISSGVRSGNQVASAVLRTLYGVSDHRTDPALAPGTEFESAMSDLGGGAEVRAAFLEKTLSPLEPSLALRTFAELLKLGVLGPRVFTTNYDTLVEKACAARGVPYQVATTLEEFATLRDDGTVQIIKLHGSLGNPDSIKCTAADVDALLPSFRELLGSTIESQGLVILGYRLHDAGVLSAIENALPTKAFLAYVAPDYPDDRTVRELGRHRSEQNVSQVVFDDFVQALNERVGAMTDYGLYGDSVKKLWESLDRMRFFSGASASELEHVALEADEIRQQVGPPLSSEASAIAATARFERSQRADSESLAEVQSSLRSAFTRRRWLDHDERARTLGRLALELARTQFHGVDGRPLASGIAGDDHATAEIWLSDLENEFEELIADGVPRRRLAEAMVFIAEMKKELHALHVHLVSTEGEEMAPDLKEAEWLLEIVINELTVLDALGDHATPREDWLCALAHRHLAIVHEYYQALPIASPRRELHHNEWVRHSRMAAEILAPYDEAFVRGYALMNWATSEVAESELYQSLTFSPKQVEDIFGRLELSIALLERVNDARGLAWGYVQWALALTRVAAQDDADPEAAFARDAYRKAMCARTWAHRTATDRLVVGFADYLAARTLLELCTRGVDVLGSSDEQLQFVLDLAEAARDALRGTSRDGTAARCSLIRGEALLQLANGADNWASLLSAAIQAEVDAIADLTRANEFVQRDLQAQFRALRSEVRRTLKELAL